MIPKDHYIIVCIRGEKPWAICMINKAGAGYTFDYYSIVAKYVSYSEAAAALTDAIKTNIIQSEGL